MEQKIKIGIISDNYIFLSGLSRSLEKTGRYEVALKSGVEGKLLRVFDKEEDIPELFVLHTEELNADTALSVSALKGFYPTGKVLLMSGFDNQYNLVKAFKYNANGFIARNCGLEELHRSLLSIYYTGIYYNEAYGNLGLYFTDAALLDAMTNITDLEREALGYFATELSYKEIADAMNTSIEMIEAYRDLLFQKFNVKSRIGLVVWAYAIGEITKMAV